LIVSLPLWRHGQARARTQHGAMKSLRIVCTRCNRLVKQNGEHLLGILGALVLLSLAFIG
jgi:hypothetical protein